MPELLLGPASEQVVLEIAYMPGAEPYTVPIPNVEGIWELSRTNLERLFSKRVTIPISLSQMTALTDVTGGEFSGARIREIAASHRQQQSGDGKALLYVMWLAGYYHDGTDVRPDVLAVTIRDVIAMFKPVIQATASPEHPMIERFVEQVTLVHEVAHTAGLVNNGAPMVSPHQDSEHGHHCTDDKCILYYLYEGAQAVTQFVINYVTTQNTIVIGSECLADVDAYGRTLR